MAELKRLNGPRLLLVHVRESLLEGFPLELNLFQHSLHEVHLLDLFIKDSLVNLLIALGDNFDVFLILGVALGVVTEVETLGFLDLTSHPLAEISVVDLALFLVILVNNKFSEVLEVHVLVLTAKEPEDVVDGHEAIVVAVQVQEGLPHTHPVVREFVLDKLLQTVQTRCYSILVRLSR